jgi:drug/metabolite transporter (DMT)-like permease
VKINKGLIAATLAPFFIALSIMDVKMAGNGASPLVLAGLGPLLSVPFLFLLQIGSKTPLGFAELLKPPARDPFLRVVVTRSLIGQILITVGFTLTTGIKSILLLRMEPLFVVLWALLLRNEKPGPKKLLFLVLLVLGSAIVVAPGSQAASSVKGSALNLGDAMILASLLFMSYSYLPTKEVVSKTNPAALNILGNLIGGVVISVLALCTHGPTCFIMSFFAFKTYKPWVVASFLSLEVVFGLILAFLLLHECMSVAQFVGATIVCLAMLGIAKVSSVEEQLQVS